MNIRNRKVRTVDELTKEGNVAELVNLFYSSEDVLKYMSVVRALGDIADIRAAVPILKTSYHWPIPHTIVQKACFDALMKCCNEDSVSRCFERVAQILFNQGQLNDANELYRKMHTMFIQTGDKEGVADAVLGQANVLYQEENLDEAADMYLKAEKAYRAIGATNKLAVCIGTRANVLYEKGELHFALKLHEQAREMFIESGDMKKAQAALANIEMIREELNL